MHVSAFYASSVQLGTRLDTRDTRIYITYTCSHHGMWYNTTTSTHPDMRRVQWGQSAQTTTREVSFALSLVDTH